MKKELEEVKILEAFNNLCEEFSIPYLKLSIIPIEVLEEFINNPLWRDLLKTPRHLLKYLKENGIKLYLFPPYSQDKIISFLEERNLIETEEFTPISEQLYGLTPTSFITEDQEFWNSCLDYGFILLFHDENPKLTFIPYEEDREVEE